MFYFSSDFCSTMASLSIQRSSSSFTSRSQWSYDVFLSFRGEDTRKSFTDHLYSALIRNNINTFRDDEEHPRGGEIAPELLKSYWRIKDCNYCFLKNLCSFQMVSGRACQDHAMQRGKETNGYPNFLSCGSVWSAEPNWDLRRSIYPSWEECRWGEKGKDKEMEDCPEASKQSSRIWYKVRIFVKPPHLRRWWEFSIYNHL